MLPMLDRTCRDQGQGDNPARGQLFFCFMATVTPLQKYPMSHPMSREMVSMWMDLHTPSAWRSSSKNTPF